MPDLYSLLEVVLPRATFVLLSALVVLPRVRFEWAVAAFLLVVHIDVAGRDFASASSLGLWNAWKAVVLPTALFLKTSLQPLQLIRKSTLFWLWLAFVGYVAIAVGWSPFRLSAVKQLGFLYSYTVLFLALLHGHLVSGRRMYRPFSWSVVGALVLATVYTYGLGGGDVPGLEGRFTAFTAPQGFGLYLAVAFGVTLAYSGQAIRGGVPVPILGVLILVALWLNGSRAGAVGALAVLAMAVLYRPAVRRSWAAAVGLIAVVFLGSVMTLAGGYAVRYLSPETAETVASQRSIELFATLSGGDLSVDEIATMAWRLGMYRTMIVRVAERGPQELLMGSGTSATGEIVSEGIYSYRWYDEETVDPNRLAHNELLRSVYEWGIVGAGLFVALVVITLKVSLTVLRRTRTREAFGLLGIVLLGTLYLLFENLFAAPASPFGATLAFALASMAALHAQAVTPSADEPVGATEPAVL